MHFCARCSILSYTRCNSAVPNWHRWVASRVLISIIHNWQLLVKCTGGRNTAVEDIFVQSCIKVTREGHLGSLRSFIPTLSIKTFKNCLIKSFAVPINCLNNVLSYGNFFYSILSIMYSTRSSLIVVKFVWSVMSIFLSFFHSLCHICPEI